MALAQSPRRSQRIIDGALELKASGTVTSTTSETGIEFACRKVEEFKAIVAVSAFDFTTTDETYVVKVEVSDVVGGTYTQIGESLTIVATGVYEIALSGTIAEQVDADAEFVRITATLGGTTPSLTYQAYLGRV
jgi:hypothetical protein